MCFLLLLKAHETVLSATRTELSTGRWKQCSRWSGGQLPACGDSIVINAGITVEVTSILDFSLNNAPFHLKTKGTLTFQTGKKLRLPCYNSVTIETRALISGGGGLQYYRLRQVDIDGKSTLSRTLAVKWNLLYVFQIYPNPSTGELFANIDPQLIGQTGKLIINSPDGKLHILRDIKVETTSFGVKLLKNRGFLKPGSYMISLNFKNHNYSQMVIAKQTQVKYLYRSSTVWQLMAD